MRSREIPEDVIAAEMERLEGSGLIDDDALAEELVDKYSHRGGLGRRGVAEKLRHRKLSPDTIERALAALSADDELDQLREVAQSRARSLTKLPAEVATRRLVAYLNRRGYSGSAVYEVVRDVVN
jgi:regulatory protein